MLSENVMHWLQDNAVPVGSYAMFGEGADIDYLVTWEQFQHLHSAYELLLNQDALKDIGGSLIGEQYTFKYDYNGVVINIITRDAGSDFQAFAITQTMFEAAIAMHGTFADCVRPKSKRVELYALIRAWLEENLQQQEQEVLDTIDDLPF